VSWARLDDRFHDNRKIRRLWRRNVGAVGLHVMAITYCAGNETDGLVDLEFVEERVPQARERDPMVAALVDIGLWVASEDGLSWRIHDYLEFNPSHESLVAKRAADVERKRRGRDTQAEIRDSSARNPNGRTSDSKRSPVRILAESEGKASGIRAVSSGPDPTRPLNPPVVPPGGRTRDVAAFKDACESYGRQHFPELAAAAYRTGGTKGGAAVEQAVKAGATTHEAIVAHIAQWWLEPQREQTPDA
jgi:hypothetical protein